MIPHLSLLVVEVLCIILCYIFCTRTIDGQHAMHLHMSKAIVSYTWIYNGKIASEIHEVLKDLDCTNKTLSSLQRNPEDKAEGERRLKTQTRCLSMSVKLIWVLKNNTGSKWESYTAELYEIIIHWNISLHSNILKLHIYQIGWLTSWVCNLPWRKTD